MENTETVMIKKLADGYQMMVQHDQSGSAYGCELSESAYEQLRLHFVMDQEKGSCPECGEELFNDWSGVKCSKCEYWHCY